MSPSRHDGRGTPPGDPFGGRRRMIVLLAAAAMVLLAAIAFGPNLGTDAPLPEAATTAPGAAADATAD